MYKSTKITVALILGALVSLSALAAGTVYVKVNGVSISQNFANAFLAEQRARGMPDTDEMHKAVREELIRRELLVQQAKKEKIDKDPEIAAQAEAARQSILIRGYVNRYLQKNPVKDEQIKAEYENVKKQVGDTEYKVRHILLKEEAEAAAIIAKLEKGEKFEELASQSIDSSKDKGGDLGWASANNYVQPFASALVQMEKGKFTKKPVQSQFGYHVILLEDTRPVTFPSLEEIKPRLLQQIQTQQVTQMVDSLRNKAKIEE